MRRVVAATHGSLDPQALRSEGVSPEGVIDFSSNRAPEGPSPRALSAVHAVVLDAYPDPRARTFCAAAAAFHRVDEGCVVAGNGSTELIRLIAQLTLLPGDVALALAPSFGEYRVATELAGACFAEVELTSRGPGLGFHCESRRVQAELAELAPSLCWLCSPNNPTGLALPAAAISDLVALFPRTLFVLDEAYCDLLPEPQWDAELLEAGNLMVLRSMTKAWGLAGLRLGYALLGKDGADALRAASPPWSVNACAQAAGVAVLDDEGHHERSTRLLRRERDRLAAALHRSGWVVEPSDAGFFLVRTGDGALTRSALLAHGCLVRDCASFGLPAHVRVSPRHPAHNDVLLAAFASLESTSSR